jgi:hypothetical protein
MVFARGITEMSKALISMVRREIDRARNTGGVRLGLPKVTIDAAHIEMLCNLVEQAARAQDGGEPVTDFEIECDCGDLYRADSFGGGFIAGAGMCENCLTTHNSDHMASAVVPEWTNVNEKLPIDVGQVLMVFGEPLFGTSNPTIETGYYDKESEAWRFWTFDKEVNGFGVTHWMLLPEPPKQDPLN